MRGAATPETRERSHDRRRGPADHRRPRQGGRQGPRAQGGRPADHRADHAGPTTSCCPACCTWPSCAARSPTRKIAAVDVERGQVGAGRGRRVHRRRPRREQGALPCAWPVTADMVTPSTPRWPSTRSTTSARRSPSSWPEQGRRRGRGRADRRRLRPAAGRHRHGGGAGRGRRPRATPTWSPTRASGGCSTPATPAPGGNIDEAFADADVIVSRRFLQQRLIPAFMEPRSTVVQPNGDNFTCGPPPRCRTSCGSCWR